MCLINAVYFNGDGVYRFDETDTRPRPRGRHHLWGACRGPRAFVFDRPFLFAIRERLSGTVLFIGVIGDPTV